MSYTIKITETTPQKLPIEQEEELESRYEYVLKNPNVGKTWDEFEKSL